MKSGLASAAHRRILPSCHGLECSAVVFGITSLCRTQSFNFKIAADRMLKNLGLKRATLHAGFSERSSPDSTFYDMKSGFEGGPFILPSCHGLECSAVVFGIGLFEYKAKCLKSFNGYCGCDAILSQYDESHDVILRVLN